MPASSNASSPPLPAARQAKPGSAQRKRQAKLRQQAAAAQQSGSSSSAADLNPATDQAKPHKPAAVPAGNQPETTSPSQPTSKAVQSSDVPAGVGIQPPLVVLESDVITAVATAAELDSSSGAITWL